MRSTFFSSEFLLTRPSRGVTMKRSDMPAGKGFLLTRPSRGVTLQVAVMLVNLIISIHTPLAGRDTRCGHAIT